CGFARQRTRATSFLSVGSRFLRTIQAEAHPLRTKADNPTPNRLLQRIGFPLISTRIGRSSELSMICKLNRYDIVRGIAEHYLLTRTSHKNDGQSIRGFDAPRLLS